jgi:hydrogenase expression/formation protein HypE
MVHFQSEMTGLENEKSKIPTIRLGHGSGGILTRRLIKDKLLRYFTSPLLSPLKDSATVVVHGGEISFTTDTYVVDPIFFPGGNIGKLAVYGTVNDLAVVGAIPHFISCALILEEGFPENELDVILNSMVEAADVAGVEVVTGDTKVVPRGKADKIFINTSGLGIKRHGGRLPNAEMKPGDVLLLSGPLGDHGAAVLSKRGGLNLESTVLSDCAPVTAIAQAMLESAGRVSFMRDITRGGLATVLNEAVEASNLGIILVEKDIPVRPEVRSICELLGLDPMYLACEGRVAAVVDGESAVHVVRAVKAAPGGEGVAVIGMVSDRYRGEVVAETQLGTRRLVQMLSGEQLPRIC